MKCACYQKEKQIKKQGYNIQPLTKIKNMYENK